MGMGEELTEEIIREIIKTTPADKWANVPGTAFKKTEVQMFGKYVQVFIKK